MCAYNISSLKKGLVAHYPLKGKLGPELVSNGTFDADTDWTKDTGWTISGGVAAFDASVGGVGSLGELKQTPEGFPNTSFVGKRYVLKYEVKSNSLNNSATLQIQGGQYGIGSTTTIIDSTVGGHSLMFTYDSSSTSSQLSIQNKDSTSGSISIDNVSLKEILPGKVGSPTYESSFVSNNDGFSAVRGTNDGNIDSITDDNGVTENNTLRTYADNSTNTHYIGTQSISPGLTTGVSYRCTFKFYIPSANTHVDGIKVNYRVAGVYTNSKSFESSAGVWTQAVIDFPVIGVGFDADNRMDIYMLDGTSESWTGAGAVGDDLVYIKDFKFLPIETPDVTPYSNHGVVYGATQNSENIEFNGTTDYVDLGSDIPNDGTGELSISAWVYLTGWGESSSGTNGVGRILDNGKILVYAAEATEWLVFSSNASNAANSANSSISLNEWIHVAVTRNSAGTATNIYINGALSDDADQDSGTPVAATTNATIGNRVAGDRAFDGNIKDFKIWNRILTAEEIELDYKGANPNIDVGSLKKGLVLDMPLDEKNEKVGSEIIINGDMNSVVTPWVNNSSGTANLSIVSSGGVDDSSYIDITRDDTDKGIRQSVSLEAGKSYHLEAWVKGTDGKSGYLQIYKAGGVNQIDYFTLTTSWQKVSIDFDGVNTESGNLVWIITTSTGSYDFFVDKVSLREIKTADTTPNENHGIVYGATQNTNDMEFDGTNDYIYLGNIEEGNFGYNDFTVSTWVKFPLSGINNWESVISKGFTTSAPAKSWAISRRSTATDNISFQAATSTGGAFSINLNITDNISDGWHLVTGVRKGNVAYLFLDGVVNQIQSGITVVDLTNSNNLYIGKNDANWYINTSIKQVKIYNRALTPQEIERLYKQGLTQ